MSRPTRRGRGPSSANRKNSAKPRVVPTAPLGDIGDLDLSQPLDPLSEQTPTVPLEPLTLEGVITEQFGAPRNDGSPDSARYEVPIKLNRAPDDIEKQLIKETWEHLPQITGIDLHGTLDIVGDTLVVRQTTIVEVKEVHTTTLPLIVNRVNTQVAQQRQDTADAEIAKQEELERHRQHVNEVASRIEF